MTSEWRDIHARHSVLREVILEHQLTASLLQRLWQRGVFDVEILHSAFDAGGYDLVLSGRSIMRHVQLKASRAGASTRSQKVESRWPGAKQVASSGWRSTTVSIS